MIAFYSGKFDPPTMGHYNVIAHLSQMFDRVYVSPCTWHWTDKPMTNKSHRQNMLGLLIRNLYNVHRNLSFKDDGFFVSQYEQVNNFLVSKGETPYIVIGQDNANDYLSWGTEEEVNQILETVKFCVVSRPGYDDGTHDWYKKEPHMFLEIPNYDISSTHVKKTNNFDLVPPVIREYIEENGLYIER